MQVRAGGGAGRADPADDVAAAYLLPGGHEDLRLVAVAGGQVAALVLAVRDAGVVAVPARPAGEQNPAVGGGVDRLPGRRRDVRTGVQLPHILVRVIAHPEVPAFPSGSWHQEERPAVVRWG